MSSPAKEALTRLSRKSKSGLVTIEQAATALGVSRLAAATRLANLHHQGWVKRVRRGLYLILPLESDTAQPVSVEDSWTLAGELYKPCYIGGWSAAEHWEMTEQIFRSTFVVTAANIRRREQIVLGAEFRLVRAALPRVESVGQIWRGRARVKVSSAERTLVDALVDPAWAGGVRHLAEMLSSYRDLPAGSATAFARELRSNGNGAAHKRAGFLAERIWPEAKELIEIAAEGRSAGVIRLDPAIARRGRMNRRWGLWINATVPEPAR